MQTAHKSQNKVIKLILFTLSHRVSLFSSADAVASNIRHKGSRNRNYTHTDKRAIGCCVNAKISIGQFADSVFRSRKSNRNSEESPRTTSNRKNKYSVRTQRPEVDYSAPTKFRVFVSSRDEPKHS